MDKVILGENAVYDSDSEKTGLNNNILVVGPSGSGKTFSIAAARMQETHESSIVVGLTKKWLSDMYQPLYKERGYTTWNLNLAAPHLSSIGFDPLISCRSQRDLVDLGNAILKANKKSENTTADPYWDESGCSLFCALGGAAREIDRYAGMNDFLDIFDKLKVDSDNDDISTPIDALFDRIERKNPRCFAVSCWKSFRQLPPKTAKCVYGTLSTALDTIFTPEIRTLMSKPEKIDFTELGKKKIFLAVTTSPVNTALHCLANIFYAQMIKELFEYAETREDGRLPVPVHAVFDDFATGSRIHKFPEYLSIFREKQISVTLLLQSESQLESMYGVSETTSIINNCDTYVYLGGSDLRTAQHMSLRMNTPLDEVLYMPLGQEVILRRGQRPLITQRYNIKETPIYKSLAARREQRADASK